MNDKLKAARRKAEKIGVNRLKRHVLMCFDRQTASCASAKQMSQSWKYLSQRMKELGLRPRKGFFRSKCPCLGICRSGPILVVYPDAVWYGGCKPAVIERILQEHVLGGQVVEEYVLARGPRPDAGPAN